MWRTVLIICLTLTVFGCNGDDNPVQPTPTSFKVRIENASAVFDFLTSGVFNMPVGAASPGPIGPGGAYEFTFDAGLGSRLSFVSMFVPSNDLFFAPDENGIALFNGDRTPVNGDVTSQIELWDAGTEENQEPGVGQDQVQRQSGPNTGASDSNNSVRLVNDGFSYPSVSDVIKVTITANSETNFTVRIENVSTGTTLQPSDGSMQAVPLSPGVWVVHTEAEPLFTSGQSDRDEGLEAIAEDGNPSSLGGVLSAETGLTVP
ncbi:hypothetical protein GWO43_29640, partial [candidate division KSB1 bacterium]|nr:hypothetical protein [candidate division KSB1 bacterium]NIR72036.1 hypothetical protein [candidate division KSB1 bacterium]NIS25977.1 hypothetical protein [candidate division KSB1 bacterium]NIT74948.1 hypothetical protein [candidate division KSB1 bacterium]NIU28732.1 hypothetical protein [candidate division KSB1 bacterium]